MSLPVIAVGVAVLAWAWLNLAPPWSVIPVLAAVASAGRASRPFRGRRRLLAPVYRSVMAPPPGIVAAVEDLAPVFGLRARRIQVVVQRYGRGRARHLPLAAAAGWRGGGVVIADDDLAAKSLSSQPGDRVDGEVRAVVSHELGHLYALHSITSVADRFTLTAVVTTSVCGALRQRAVAGVTSPAWLAVHGVVLVGVLAVSVLAMRWESRVCEYAADRKAAAALGTGAALAAALTHDFGGHSSGWRALWSTHPPIDKRAARLRRVA
ncbi:MAG: M48 family metalloprotease [Actinomycetota bacterium]|nr:M48 family metalloprotease [Actinomycetota bacterium]